MHNFRSGKFRAIGVSNYEESHLQELLASPSTVRPAVNQFECHPRRPASALRRACQDAGVAVVAYASLGSGDLLGRAEVTRLAKDQGKTPSQVSGGSFTL